MNQIYFYFIIIQLVIKIKKITIVVFEIDFLIFLFKYIINIIL